MSSTALVTMDEMSRMAASMVKSKMFGFKTVEEAMSIMLIAQAEGRPAALAARDYHVIQGRPALKADAMLARFQQEGGVVEWDEYTDSKVTGRFSHPKSCPKPVAITWTLDMAKRIGLATRENWRNYPRAMLRSRVISEGVRSVYPGIAVGIYTVDEMQDLAKEKDITPTAGAGDSLTEERRLEITEIADRMREWLNQGSLTDAHDEMENKALDADEQVYLWTHFDSRVRRQLKEEGERQRIKARAITSTETITDAQRKRLEARIKESGTDREAVKAECVRLFQKAHFAELTREEYEIIDTQLESAPPPPSSSPDTQGATVDSPRQPETASGADPHEALRAALGFASKTLNNRFKARLAAGGHKAIEDMTPEQSRKAAQWVSDETDKETA